MGDQSNSWRCPNLRYQPRLGSRTLSRDGIRHGDIWVLGLGLTILGFCSKHLKAQVSIRLQIQIVRGKRMASCVSQGRNKALARWLQCFMVAAATFLLFPTVVVNAQQGMPSRVEVQQWLEQYEQAYHGMEVLAPISDSTSTPPLTRISRGGDCVIWECHDKNNVDGHGLVETITVVYSCPKFSVRLNQSKLNGSLRGVLNHGTLAPVNFAAMMEFSCFLGYSGVNGLRFSQIVSHPRASVEIEPANRFDQDGILVIAKIPRQPTLELFFVQKEAPRLLGIKTIVSKGDELIDWQGVYRYGEPPPKEWDELTNTGLNDKYSETEVGPIEYDSKGKPKAANTHSITISNNDERSVFQFRFEILSYSPLREDLPPNQVVTTKMKLPERLAIQMYGTNVPHELRDGRLVSLLDGVAMEVGSKVGFRKPSGYERFGWLALFVTLLVLLGIAYYVYRKRME